MTTNDNFADVEAGPSPQARSLKDYGLLVLKGFAMGASDVVPGVSGGTMAFILGIYEELIEAIKSVDLTVLKLGITFKWKAMFAKVPWQFLLAVFMGILLAIFSLAQVLEWTLENRPLLLWPFFFGLILASIILVSRRVSKWKGDTIAVAVVATILSFIIVGMVPTQTPDTPLFIFFSGAIAICAMILPGISGSFILVLLGKYQTILSAVNDRDFVTLLIFMAGAVIGLATFARFLSWLFNRYHDLAVAMLTGLMLGSLRKIWLETAAAITGQHSDTGPVNTLAVFDPVYLPQILVAIGLGIFGLIVVLALEYIATKKGV